MTIAQKLEKYQQASEILFEINDYGWPQTSLCHTKEESTSKTSGTKSTQAWFVKDSGWTVIELESWIENSQRTGSKETHSGLTVTEAAVYFGEN
jgi:hypothetical protein